MTTTPARRVRVHIAAVLAIALTVGLWNVLQVAPSASSDDGATLQPGQSQVDALVDGDTATSTFTVQPPADGSLYVGVRVRVSDESFYLLQARLSASDPVRIALKRVTPNGITDLSPSHETQLAVSSGGTITLSLAASGASSPVLDGVISAGGSTERISFQDADAAALTTPGSAQAWSYLSSAAIGSAYAAPDAQHISPVATATLPAKAAQVWPMNEQADGAAAAFAMGLTGGPLGPQYLGVRLRVTGENYYLLQAAVGEDGAVRASLKRVRGGVATDLVASRDINLTVTSGDTLVLNIVAAGASKVSLTGSVSVAGSTDVRASSYQDTSADRLTGTGDTAAWALVGSGADSNVTVGYAPVAASATKPVASSDGTPAVPTPPPAAPPAPPAPPTPPAPPASSVGPATMPSAANTGVPAGTKLTVHEGDLVIDDPNTVISGMEIRGFVVINAPGAVIENSRIVGRATSVSAAFVTNYRSKAPFTIRNSEIVPRSASPFAMAGIMGSNFKAERLNVHGLIDGIRITGDNTTVSASWLHDNLHYDSDPMFGGEPSHDDSIQVQAGRGITITGNRAEGTYSSALMVTQDLGTIANLSVTRNYLEGGSCTVNVSDTVVGIQGVSITSNLFGPDRRVRNCAIFAPLPTIVTNQQNAWETSDDPVLVVQRF